MISQVRRLGLLYDQFIYDKSSILVLFPQMTFVLNSVPYWYDLKKDILRQEGVSHVLQVISGWLYT
jgi:hypothetical protein